MSVVEPFDGTSEETPPDRTSGETPPDGTSGELPLDGTSGEAAFDRRASEWSSFDTWWSGSLRSWEEPEVHASVPQWSESSRYWEDSGSQVSEPQWSERNDEETSKGWRTWNIREEGRSSAYPQRAQSSTDVWIPRDDDEEVWNSANGWNSRDEGTYVWIPKQVGTYVWIPKETGETAKKKSRRGKPRSRPCAKDRISAREKRVQEARDRMASPAEPSEVAKASSPAAGDEGSLSRS